MKDATFQELASLYFSTRQIIRAKLPGGKADPNAWMRFETMRYIEDANGPTMQDIADYLRIKAPSATSLVAHLARQNSVRRAVGTDDKRVTRLYLTSHGKKLLAEHRKHSVSVMRKVFADFKPDEVDELVRLLRHLRDIHDASVRR